MSLLAKIIFRMACFGTGTVIGYVQLRQCLERHYLHEGIIKDLDQQQSAENLYNLQTQGDITQRFLDVLNQHTKEVPSKTCPPPENITETFFEDEDLPYIVPTFDIREHVKTSDASGL